MDDIRIAKFETLIEDINEAIKENSKDNGNVNSPLYMVFEPDKLNEYSKIICSKAKIVLCAKKIYGLAEDYPWSVMYGAKHFGGDVKMKIDAAKDFAKYCREEQNIAEAYKFIFWCLMVLTVQKDNYNYDKKLSLICDFARMLRITDEELMDITYVIKCIYNEEGEEQYSFKSKTVPNVLGELLNLYVYDNTTSGNAGATIE
jgi:hypothetical protein